MFPFLADGLMFLDNLEGAMLHGLLIDYVHDFPVLAFWEGLLNVEGFRHYLLLAVADLSSEGFWGLEYIEHVFDMELYEVKFKLES